MKTLLAADLFCGGGGTSEGMYQACAKHQVDCKVIGVNHWKIAIETNKLNHNGDYYCATMESVDPCEVVPGGYLDVMWASPECTNHSRAKGGKPRSNQSRCQPEMLLNWVRKLVVKRLYVENVEEFLDWGPLLAKNTIIAGKKYKAGDPDPRKKGVFFRNWIESLKCSGYRVDWQLMNAADFGAPTTRVRLIVQAVRIGMGAKIQWPFPTYAKKPGLFGEKPWKTAKEIIDWETPGKSIFDRNVPLAVNTLRRIYCGIVKLWDEKHAIIFAPLLQAEIIRAAKYQTTKRKGFCPVYVLAKLPHILSNGTDLNAFMVKLRGTGKTADINQPTPTLTASGTHLALVEPFMAIMKKSSGSQTLNHPVPTLTTKEHVALVEPFISRFNGGNRNHRINNPLPTQDTSNRFGIVQPMILDMSHPSDQSISRIYTDENPLQTLTTRNNIAVMEPLILHQMSPGRTRTVEEPVPTITTTGAHSLINPLIVKFYKGGVCKSVNEPLDTVTTKDRFAVIEGNLYRLDIRFRMLQPCELAAAMSFPSSYRFKGNKTEQVKQIGNAVCPALAEALIDAALAS